MAKKIAICAALACISVASSIVLAGGAQKPAGAAGTVRPLPLPISPLDVMRASIEIPADGIWAAEGADKLSEEDWQLADQDAVSLIAATALLAGAGSGKNDAKGGHCWRWYWLPWLPGVIVFFAGLFLEFRPIPWTKIGFAAVWAIFGTCAVVLGFRKDVRRLQEEIDALNSMAPKDRV